MFDSVIIFNILTSHITYKISTGRLQSRILKTKFCRLFYWLLQFRIGTSPTTQSNRASSTQTQRNAANSTKNLSGCF